MAKEQTLCLIKPDAVASHHLGKIISTLEENNFNIIKMKMLQMNKKLAENFYSIHKEKFFYEELVQFMTSGKIVALLLERENAVKYLRKLCGDTDSRKAAVNTIRNKYGTDKSKNAIHASDSPNNASKEIAIIF